MKTKHNDTYDLVQVASDFFDRVSRQIAKPAVHPVQLIGLVRTKNPYRYAVGLIGDRIAADAGFRRPNKHRNGLIFYMPMAETSLASLVQIAPDFGLFAATQIHEHHKVHDLVAEDVLHSVMDEHADDPMIPDENLVT
jgi:hypothetical protein